MVVSGTLMLMVAIYGWYAARKDNLEKHPRFLKLMVWAIALPFIGNTVGWIVTELGRQPWVVFGVMKTEDAVSPSVTANEVLFSLITFNLLYAILGAVMVYLFVKHIKKDSTKKKETPMTTDPFSKEGTEIVSQ